MARRPFRPLGAQALMAGCGDAFDLKGLACTCDAVNSWGRLGPSLLQCDHHIKTKQADFISGPGTPAAPQEALPTSAERRPRLFGGGGGGLWNACHVGHPNHKWSHRFKICAPSGGGGGAFLGGFLGGSQQLLKLSVCCVAFGVCALSVLVLAKHPSPERRFPWRRMIVTCRNSRLKYVRVKSPIYSYAPKNSANHKPSQTIITNPKLQNARVAWAAPAEVPASSQALSAS